MRRLQAHPFALLLLVVGLSNSLGQEAADIVRMARKRLADAQTCEVVADYGHARYRECWARQPEGRVFSRLDHLEKDASVRLPGPLCNLRNAFGAWEVWRDVVLRLSYEDSVPFIPSNGVLEDEVFDPLVSKATFEGRECFVVTGRRQASGSPMTRKYLISEADYLVRGVDTSSNLPVLSSSVRFVSVQLDVPIELERFTIPTDLKQVTISSAESYSKYRLDAMNRHIRRGRLCSLLAGLAPFFAIAVGCALVYRYFLTSKD